MEAFSNFFGTPGLGEHLVGEVARQAVHGGGGAAGLHLVGRGEGSGVFCAGLQDLARVNIFGDTMRCLLGHALAGVFLGSDTLCSKNSTCHAPKRSLKLHTPHQSFTFDE